MRVVISFLVALASGCSTTECTRYTCQDEWDVGGSAQYEVCVTCDSSNCDHELIVDGAVVFMCRGGFSCTEMRFQEELAYCSSR